MSGHIVIKDADGKIFVINLKTSFSSAISHTYVASENTLAQSPKNLVDQDAFDSGFLGVNSSNDLSSFIVSRNETAEQDYLKKVLNSSLENFLQKLETNPSSISKDFYIIRYIIYHNH